MPVLRSCRLYTAHHLASKQVSARLCPSYGTTNLVLMRINNFDVLHRRFIYIHLRNTHLTTFCCLFFNAQYHIFWIQHLKVVWKLHLYGVSGRSSTIIYTIHAHFEGQVVFTTRPSVRVAHCPLVYHIYFLLSNQIRCIEFNCIYCYLNSFHSKINLLYYYFILILESANLINKRNLPLSISTSITNFFRLRTFFVI